MKLFILFIALLLSFMPFSCDLLVRQFNSVPTDSELEENFRNNRDQFDQLVKISDEDHTVIRIADDFTWVKGERISGEMGGDRPIGFSESRWNEYKDYFKRLGLDRGISRSDDGNVIVMFAYTSGLAVSGMAKGYRFSRNGEVCKKSSFENLEDESGSKFVCKEIATNWYLFVSR